MKRTRVTLAGVSALLAAAGLRGEAQQLAPDSAAERWSAHAQATAIPQANARFAAPYAGRNSFTDVAEIRPSFTATLFLGARVWGGGEVYVDPEVSAGAGVGGVVGVAGFPNGEITRVTSATPAFYVARLFLRQTFALGGGREAPAAGPNRLVEGAAALRLTLTAGKVSAADFFDGNAYAHDPRTQFLNWGLMDNGAWDYPADTRGYTWGAVAELEERRWALRLGSFMEPKAANGLVLDPRIGRAHGDALELETRHRLAGRPGRVRLLAYANHAHMGSYRVTIATPADSMDVTRTRTYSLKYGFGLSADQELSGALGAFARVGWDDGATESFAFTEVDRTASLGIDLAGAGWSRSDDHVAVAALVNGLSRDHRDYLALGGYGFLLGDGRLNYAAEKVIEAYYRLAAAGWCTVTVDYQWVSAPGDNRDRGPISVGAVRAHVEW